MKRTSRIAFCAWLLVTALLLPLGSLAASPILRVVKLPEGMAAVNGIQAGKEGDDDWFWVDIRDENGRVKTRKYGRTDQDYNLLLPAEYYYRLDGKLAQNCHIMYRSNENQEIFDENYHLLYGNLRRRESVGNTGFEIIEENADWGKSAKRILHLPDGKVSDPYPGGVKWYIAADGVYFLGRKENGEYVLLDEDFRETSLAGYQNAKFAGSDRIYVMKNDSYGYLNLKGRLQIPCIYENVAFTSTEFFNGSAVAYKDGKRGVIDANGKIEVPIIFDNLRVIDAEKKHYAVTLGDRGGMLDAHGNEILPIEYSSLSYDTTYGYIRAKKDGKYGVLDLDGNVILPVAYDSLWDEPFQVGTEWVRIFYVSQDGKFGAFRSTGEPLLPLEYDDVDTATGEPYTTRYGIKIKKDGKYGFADLNGRVIVPAEYDTISIYSAGGIIAVRKDGKCGLFTKDGTLAAPIEYDEFQTNVRKTCLGSCILGIKDGVETLYSARGKKLYDNVKTDEAVPYIITDTGKWKIDTKTGELYQHHYKIVSEFYQGGALACEDGYYGLVDPDGNILHEFEFREVVIKNQWAFDSIDAYGFAPVLSEGLINVFDGKAWGYMNTAGEMVIPPRFDRLRAPNHNTTDTFLYDAHSVECGALPFHDGYAKVSIGGVPHIIDKAGNICDSEFSQDVIDSASPYSLPQATAAPTENPNGDRAHAYDTQGNLLLQVTDGELTDAAGNRLLPDGVRAASETAIRPVASDLADGIRRFAADASDGTYLVEVKAEAAAPAAPTPTPEPPIRVTLNGNDLYLPTPAVIQNDRTMVPFRAVFEAFGMVVSWDADSRTVTANDAKRHVRMTIDDPTFTVNDRAVTTDVPPCILDDRTLIPLRAVSESLGASVDWDGENRQVNITTE